MIYWNILKCNDFLPPIIKLFAMVMQWLNSSQKDPFFQLLVFFFFFFSFFFFTFLWTTRGAKLLGVPLGVPGHKNPLTLFYPSFFGRFKPKGWNPPREKNTIFSCGFHINPSSIWQLGILYKQSMKWCGNIKIWAKKGKAIMFIKNKIT